MITTNLHFVRMMPSVIVGPYRKRNCDEYVTQMRSLIITLIIKNDILVAATPTETKISKKKQFKLLLFVTIFQEDFFFFK